MEFRVLVTGSRRATAAQAQYVEGVLNEVRLADIRIAGRVRPMVVLQGECPYGGVDLTAKLWAQNTDGVRSEDYPADWGRLGKAAGMARNSTMVDAGAELCLAFPAVGSRGTWDCLRKAVDAGIFPRLYPLHLVAPE